MFFKDDRKVLIIMEIKGSKQLYHKLFFIYTAILVCAISALVIFFLNSTKNRFLEQSLSYTEMMSESAVSYLEDTSDIAEYIHEIGRASCRERV